MNLAGKATSIRCVRVRSRDEELRERPHVHHRHALPDGPVLVRRVAVVERPEPGSRPPHPRARRDVRSCREVRFSITSWTAAARTPAARAAPVGAPSSGRRRSRRRSAPPRTPPGADRTSLPGTGPSSRSCSASRSSEERYPSAHARSRSATDTSSQRHTYPAVDSPPPARRVRGVADDLDRHPRRPSGAGRPSARGPPRARTRRSRCRGSRPRHRGAPRTERVPSPRRAAPPPPRTS